MANEIQQTINTAISSAGVNISRPISFLDDLNGTHQNTTVLDVLTTGTDVPIGSIGTVGIAFFYNADPTNYVQLGRVDGGTFHPLIRLKAGKACSFRIEPGVTIHAVANSATCKVECIVVED